MIVSIRRIVCFAAFLLMFGGIAAAAPFHLDGLNLHNGVILFENHSGQRVQVVVFWNSHALHGPVAVDPGGTFAFNNCCYAAGSVYRILASVGHQQTFTGWTKPVLCTRAHGGVAMFGFSSVAFGLRHEPDGKLGGEFINNTSNLMAFHREYQCQH